MAVATLSLRAEADLVEIVVEIARHNASAAERWYRAIWARFDLLAAQPYSGSFIQTPTQPLRCVPFGSYIIYYSVAEDGVHVVRVIHGARNQYGTV